MFFCFMHTFSQSLRISFADPAFGLEVKFESSDELSNECIGEIHTDATIRYSLRSYHGGRKFESSKELSNDCIGVESATDATICRSLRSRQEVKFETKR